MLEKNYQRHNPPCHPDVGCPWCEATPFIGPPPTFEWHVPLCNRANGCLMCEAAPYEVKKKLGWFPKSFGSPRPNTPPSSPPKSPEKPKGPCPAGEDCVCFQNWNCWMCGRCRNGCIPPCQQAVNGIKAAEYCKQQQALRKAKQQTCDPWQVPYWPEATSSPPLPPSSKATNDKPVTYNFIRPCPGEGLGGTWEYCASANLCYSCELCKVCGHCFPSCPEYLDMSASPPAPPSRTPSVSNLTFYMLSKYRGYRIL